MREERPMWDRVIHGQCLEEMRRFPDNSFHALVTDPPAGISFMGKEWDKDQGGRDAWITWMAQIMREALRVIQPGGHALVWSLPRTSHWTGYALEEAGWEVRNVITHLFGSGFPKSLNLGNGRGTDLKPACEFWWLCRKPLSEKNIAQNVLHWNGCGALNIAQCRVGLEGIEHHRTAGSGAIGTANGIYNSSKDPINRIQQEREQQGLNPRYDPSGRFPSNLLLSHDPRCIARGTKRVRANGPMGHKGRTTINDYGIYEKRSEVTHADEHGQEEVPAFECVEGCPVRVLGEQSGESTGHKNSKSDHRRYANNQILGKHLPGERNPENSYGDEGTAARYFTQFHDPLSSLDAPFHYFSKSSRRDRNSGLEGMPTSASSRNGKMNGTSEHTPKYDTPEQNDHPTVKSLALCRWLCRLVGVPGGIILDPFAGSGSTLCAAIQEGFHFIGIEQDAHYCDIARARIAHTQQASTQVESEGQEYDCVEQCPIKVLGKQSGVSVSKFAARGGTSPNPMSWGETRKDGKKMAGHSDKGTAARYFTQLPPDPVSLWDLLEECGS